jgi:hypothetical protein
MILWILMTKGLSENVTSCFRAAGRNWKVGTQTFSNSWLLMYFRFFLNKEGCWECIFNIILQKHVIVIIFKLNNKVFVI